MGIMLGLFAAVLALVLIRLETAGAVGREPSSLVTELFVDDMDSQLRQQGIGDVVVGKHIGRMMSALGGRLGAYRDAFSGTDEDLRQALARNLYRGDLPAGDALAWTADRMLAIRAGLAAMPVAALLEGEWPQG